MNIIRAIAITAALLAPLSASAKMLDHERGVEILTKGEILSSTNDREFVSSYQKSIFVCRMDKIPWLLNSSIVKVYCWDDQPK